MKFINDVAVPTTKIEKEVIENLKYNCIEKDSMCPLFLPLADENICNGTVSFINEICRLYTESDFHCGTIISWKGRWDGAVEIKVQYDDGHIQEEILGIPSNLYVLIAYYRGIGRHRKVAMVLRNGNKKI